MGMNREGLAGPEATTRGAWPYCAAIEGTCLAFETGQSLGASVLSTLLTFILAANEGGRLTLQKAGEGFTVQVTGAVYRKTEKTFDLRAAQGLRKQLNNLRAGGPIR